MERDSSKRARLVANDPRVTFADEPPAWFVYVARSVRDLQQQSAPPSSRSCCDCRGGGDAPTTTTAEPRCPCYAEAARGMDALARRGPEAVVVLAECGDGCRGGGCAPPGNNNNSCRPTQGGVGFCVEVRRTDGKGLGVFATTEPIPAGAFVMEYAGELLSRDEAEARLKNYDAARRRWRAREAAASNDGDDEKEDEEPGGASGHALLSVRLHRGPLLRVVDVDATVRGNAARFVNHSCDPNLAAVVVAPRDGGGEGGGEAARPQPPPMHVALFSRRAIAPGDELTFSYGSGGSSSSGTRCRCGAAACTGWLPGGDGEEEEAREAPS